MVAFIPTIPNSGDFLDSVSQPQLRNNNLALDARFGVDHYKYSDDTGQSGKHNKVTTPVFIDSPPTGLPPVTIEKEPKLYAFKQTDPLGVIQYSRAWNVPGSVSGTPTPINHIFSQASGITLTSGAVTDVLDFTGIPRAFVKIYYGDLVVAATKSSFEGLVIWNGTAFISTDFSNPTSLQIVSAGNKIRVRNNVGSTFTQVFWVLDALRLQ